MSDPNHNGDLRDPLPLTMDARELETELMNAQRMVIKLAFRVLELESQLKQARIVAQQLRAVL
jgi:hypothetical protein